MHPTTLAIVGAGPRGLTVLERVLEHADRLPPEARLRIELYDRGAGGQGVHRAEQPDHLLINTLASQITMFAPGSVAGDGPSLVEWAAGAGYRRVGDRFLRGGTAGRPIGANDHLPRSLLGEYLSFVYGQVVARLPTQIEVVHRRERVVDLIERDEGSDRGFTVVAEEGAARPADFVVLATGHGRRKATAQDRDHAAFAARGASRNRNLAYHPSPYPIERLDAVSASATVAIQGFGLTAHDAVSALTLGLGGRYEEVGGGLRYQPSGREPRLVLFSRSCLPFAARGINQKGLTGRHRARFFTPEAVAAIRQETLTATGDDRIDFEGAVLPLVVKEMAYAYREAASGAAPDPDAFVPTQDEARAIAAILEPLDGRTFASSAAFDAFFDRLLAEDLDEAHKGNRASPVKAATDVLRDTREAIRTAVEYGGLTPDSHRVFVEGFNGTINRVAFGPPKRRNLEYLALREAGLIRVGGGPGSCVRADADEARFRIETPYADGIEAVQADVLVVARLDTYSPLTDDAPLTANLLARGLIRPYRNGAYHPGGIDIDAALHAVGASGQAHPRLWALGYPVEGPHYYTHALPRPGMASRQTRDAETCVLAMLDILAGARSSDAGRMTAPISAARPAALGAVQAHPGAP